MARNSYCKAVMKLREEILGHGEYPVPEGYKRILKRQHKEYAQKEEQLWELYHGNSRVNRFSR